VAKTQAGRPCKRQAILGGTVCATHGGSAPQVKEKARQRLLAMVLPSLKELEKVLAQTGVTDSNKMRAIESILDRNGLTGALNVQLDVMTQFTQGMAEDVVWMDDDDAAEFQNAEHLHAENANLRAEVERLRDAAAAAGQARPAITATRTGEPLEGVVVEPGEPGYGPTDVDRNEVDAARLRAYRRRLLDETDDRATWSR
jgi:cell division protein FtsB